MNQRIFNYLPQCDYEEAMWIGQMTQSLNDEALQQFAAMYSTRRKDAQTVLLLALLGFIGVAGIHRFILNQIGMGILYFLTAGLCFIGTIVDLINYKQLALQYNQKVAREVMMLVSSFQK